MMAREFYDGMYWLIFDFTGWHAVNMFAIPNDMYTLTSMEH